MWGFLSFASELCRNTAHSQKTKITASFLSFATRNRNPVSDGGQALVVAFLLTTIYKMDACRNASKLRRPDVLPQLLGA
jgi:hypothetical protein